MGSQKVSLQLAFSSLSLLEKLCMLKNFGSLANYVLTIFLLSRYGLIVLHKTVGLIFTVSIDKNNGGAMC